MEYDDENVVVIGNAQQPDYEFQYESRVMPNGGVYRVPDPSMRVIHLEHDCGLLLDDIEFLRLPAGTHHRQNAAAVPLLRAPDGKAH